MADTTTLAPFSPIEAITHGWTETLRSYRFVVPLAFATLVLSAIEASAQRQGHTLLHLVLQIGTTLVSMGWWRVASRLEDRRIVSVATLTDVTLIGFLRYAITLLVYWIIVGVGLVLLIVPGLYYAARLSLAPALVVSEELEPIEALKVSHRLTQGALAELWIFGLLLMLMNAAGAALFGLGLLVTMPATFLAVVHVLRQLEAREVRASAPSAPHEGPLPVGI